MLPVTLLAVPIRIEESDDAASSALECASRARRRGVDLIEWRLDALATSSGGADAARRLVCESPLPCIATCRCPDEGGAARVPDADRLAILAAAAQAGARYVDIELRTWRACREAARGVLGDGVDGPGLILSSHDFEGRPADLLQRVEAMTSESACRVVKMVWTARSLRDGLEAFDLLAQRGKPTIALCMGGFGVPTRLLAAKFGAFLTFVTAGDEGTAPGQVDLDEWFDVYRADRVGRATRVYGVVGWPVAHSRGPAIHNAAFADAGFDGVYLHLPVAPGYEPLKATLGAFIAHDDLDFAGASVTLPHKSDLPRFVEESGGVVDALTARIGAANTLVVAPGGGLRGLNTDAPAAREVVESVAAVNGASVVILGAGGVARAVAAVLQDAGGHVAIVARTRSRAEAIAADLGPGVDVLDAVPPDADVLVNATPVGMIGGPDPDGSPLPDGYAITRSMTVFDTVYAPERTPLVRAAETAGARVVLGTAMFERQAALQRAAWLDG